MRRSASSTCQGRAARAWTPSRSARCPTWTHSAWWCGASREWMAPRRSRCAICASSTPSWCCPTWASWSAGSTGCARSTPARPVASGTICPICSAISSPGSRCAPSAGARPSSARWRTSASSRAALCWWCSTWPRPTPPARWLPSWRRRSAPAGRKGWRSAPRSRRRSRTWTRPSSRPSWNRSGFASPRASVSSALPTTCSTSPPSSRWARTRCAPGPSTAATGRRGRRAGSTPTWSAASSAPRSCTTRTSWRPAARPRRASAGGCGWRARSTWCGTGTSCTSAQPCNRVDLHGNGAWRVPRRVSVRGMILLRRRLAVAALLLAGTPLAARAGFRCPAKGGPEWREYRSQHFVVQADGARVRVGALIRQLESMHVLELQALVGEQLEIPCRIRVIAYRDPNLFTEVAGRFYIAAFYGHSRMREPIIVLPFGGVEARPETVAHEVAHHLSRFLFPRQPAWFAEGLAEFVQTIANTGPQLTPELGSHIVRGNPDQRGVGAAPVEMSAALKEAPLVRVQELLQWDGEEESMTGKYHLHSWLLYHWLWNNRAKQFTAFQQR